MPKISGIKIISFDGDGTLWDFNKVMKHSLGCVLEELRKIAPKTASLLNMEKMIEIRNQVSLQLEGKETNLENIRFFAFKQTLEEIGKPNDSLATYMNTIYLKHRFEDIELFDDVLSTFKILQKKYALGLLSNGNSYPDKCGLEGIFHFVVFSQDYGIEKPDPRIFQIALKKAEVEPDEFIHIGDSLRNDIFGANQTGIKSIWLNRKQIKNNLGVEVEYECKSLTELLEFL